jgi:ubiquinone/menaquinone biosynthesis C-methylase UbiE
MFKPIYHALGEAVRPHEGGRLLDVGCGTGTLTISLAGASARAFGVDPAPQMVMKASTKKAGAPVWFAVAEAEALPFPGTSFDGAAASLTLHHWRDPERGLAELARVLRPGSRLAIAELDLPRAVRWLLRAVGNVHAGWSRRDLADLLYRSGFSRVRALSRSPIRPLAIVTAER